MNKVDKIYGRTKVINRIILKSIKLGHLPRRTFVKDLLGRFTAIFGILSYIISAKTKVMGSNQRNFWNVL